MYLVVWTTPLDRHPHVLFRDEWSAHETLSEAEAAYAEQLDDPSCYSVSICVPIKSTDYSNTHWSYTL
jgi:hypothetical protein